MAYSELVKSFERIRNYMREFYVYGFKSRDEYGMKSARRKLAGRLHVFSSRVIRKESISLYG